MYEVCLAVTDGNGCSDTTCDSLSVQEEGITGEGYILSKNSDFSTDDREFSVEATLYMMLYSEFIDVDQVSKTQWELKVGRTRLKGTLSNNGDGTFTASQGLSQFSAGDIGFVKLKVEANKRVEYKNIEITITE